MAQIGNKINSWLNGEWAKHGRPYGKKLAAHRRRIISKLIIRKERDNNEQLATTREVRRKTHYRRATNISEHSWKLRAKGL